VKKNGHFLFHFHYCPCLFLPFSPLYHFYIFYFNQILPFLWISTAQIQLFYYLAHIDSLVLLKILYFHYMYFHFIVKVGESLKIVLGLCICKI
jgi:hypothetical protein